MKVFKITGTFQMGRYRKQPFTKEVAAEDDARAREILFSDLGSKHGTPRRRIAIAAVVEVPADQVESGVTRAKAGILS
jgi:ribosomal protein L20A (L18A)